MAELVQPPLQIDQNRDRRFFSEWKKGIPEYAQRIAVGASNSAAANPAASAKLERRRGQPVLLEVAAVRA